jgi:glycosyltransferase involved in cell wall biosynthesis
MNLKRYKKNQSVSPLSPEETKFIKLSELPLPPLGKTGWPWTEGTPQIPDNLPDGRLWPRISVVTPSYNYAQYLEETIRSVLLQGYPNLEYIVIDGGSNDGSLDIIRKYEKWLAYWESGKDGGQSDAINKGFKHSTGQIMAWLNSDDFYISGALEQVGMNFASERYDLVSGMRFVVDAESRVLQVGKPVHPQSAEAILISGKSGVSQPATFWSRACWETFGPLDTSLHYAMDFDFFLRCALGGVHWGAANSVLATYRHHNLQKTSAPAFANMERRRVVERLYSRGDVWGGEIAHAFERALHYEGWYMHWNARYYLKERIIPKRLWKLLAVFVNWRCLFVKQYYPSWLQWLADRLLVI